MPINQIVPALAGYSTTDINNLVGNDASKFFYSEYDKEKHFEYKIVYNSNNIPIADKTTENKKKAWYETLMHHWEYCQALPTGIFTFYNASGPTQANKITINEETLEDIRSYNLHEDPTWQELYNSYMATIDQNKNYADATAINKSAYNRAAYVTITNSYRLSEAEFSRLIKQINSVFKFNLPTLVGTYYYDKIENEWILYV